MANHVAAGRLQATGPLRLIRFLWGVLATVLSLLYTAMLAPPAALLAGLGFSRAVGALSQLWGWLIVRTCGVTVDIEGIEHLRGLKSYVLVANHQSFFDIFAVVAFLPGHIRFVAKKELLRIPFVGYALKHNGHIIVDRQRGGKSIRHALAAARDNYPICVFAEGHRYNDGHVHEFSDGAAWLAVTARLPCVPTAISGSGAFFPRGAMIVVPGGTMKMKILPPISTADLRSADRAELTRRLEQAVRSAVEP
jgi:1-acyl-sn-glycerol-3-phosphate acyltransferase